MKNLSPDWLTEGLVDFEYKKYVLLAYLKEVSKNFDEKRLYPFLSDLICHYDNLKAIKNNTDKVREAMPRKIKRVDLENFRIEFERIMHDDQHISEIYDIISFAMPLFKSRMDSGKELYDKVEQNIKIEPVGILPLNTDSGYLLLINGAKADTKVYDYEITIFDGPREKFRAIRTSYVNSYVHKLTNTCQAIKLDLLRQRKSLPNPAAFLVQSQMAFPLASTLLPIAKRSLVRFINNANGA